MSVIYYAVDYVSPVHFDQDLLGEQHRSEVVSVIDVLDLLVAPVLVVSYACRSVCSV